MFSHRIICRLSWRGTLAGVFRLSLFVALIGPAQAAEKFTLRGEVHLDGEVLQGRRALVHLYAAHRPFQTQTWTDLGGKFRFNNLSAGLYLISAEIQEMASAPVSVDVSATLADDRGRVHHVIELKTTVTSSHSEVSVAELAISKPARKAYERAEKLLAKGEIDRATALLTRTVEQEPTFVRALNTLGTIAYHRRDFEEAEARFRQALEADPRAYIPLVNLGGALVSRRRFEEAVEVNLAAVRDRPNDPLANSQLGLSYWGLGGTAEAIRYLRRAKELDPAHFSFPQLALARIFLALNKIEEGRLELEEFVRLHPDSSEAESSRKLLRELSRDNSGRG